MFRRGYSHYHDSPHHFNMPLSNEIIVRSVQCIFMCIVLFEDASRVLEHVEKFTPLFFLDVCSREAHSSFKFVVFVSLLCCDSSHC